MLLFGRTQGYWWLEEPRGELVDLLRACPEIVIEQVVVVAAYDGGPFRPAPEDVRRGWSTRGDLAISPRVVSPADLPSAEWDEWYVFADIPSTDSLRVFVNHGGFSLNDPGNLLVNMDPTWDRKAALDQVARTRGIQEEFWLQLATVGADSLLSTGDNLICATRRRELRDALARFAGIV